MLIGDYFPLDSCSCKKQWRDWDRVYSKFLSAHCPSAVSHSPRYSNSVLDGVFVPSALRFQSSDFTCSKNTICIPNETFCTVASHSSQILDLYLGFTLFMGSVVSCFANTFSPNGTNPCDCVLPCSISKSVFPLRSFRHLDKIHPACSTNHGPNSLHLICDVDVSSPFLTIRHSDGSVRPLYALGFFDFVLLHLSTQILKFPKAHRSCCVLGHFHLQVHPLESPVRPEPLVQHQKRRSGPSASSI